jgi:hypothetical protein
MGQKDLLIETGEKMIDVWPVMYSPPGGGTYETRCAVTNRRLLFTGDRMNITADLTGLVDLTTGNAGCLVIPKSRITLIEAERSYLEKTITLTLDNGKRHALSYGALNIDRLVEAISSVEENSLIKNTKS